MERDGVDQASVARATKIPATTIARLRSRETINPTYATLRALAKFFGVSLSELVGERAIPGLDATYSGEFSIPYPSTPEALALIRELSRMDQEGNCDQRVCLALLHLLQTLSH